MHIHILGICGTFMGSLAQLARQLGHRVTGSDSGVYPPMSEQLQAAGIDLIEGYDIAQLQPRPDLVIVGNAMSRGNPVLEEVLNRRIPYTSGPQWLCDQVLNDRWVLAVAGTHGKTTTASMLAWILEFNGLQPGYLIGGVAKNFARSASLGESSFFVVEADEYDTAFFDKRSKFVHYRPNTLVINNLEYDHADIFPDLAAIRTQFHHLIRTVPGSGLIVRPLLDENLDAVFARGCWTPVEYLQVSGGNAVESRESAPQWQARLRKADASAFTVIQRGVSVGEVEWTLTGEHNVSNATAAIAAARNVGVTARDACEALSRFEGVKRRMDLLADIDGVCVYDDFAHHPTAIASTLQGLRARDTSARIVALIEPRSNTMRMGIHREALVNATADADQVLWYSPADLDWDLSQLAAQGPVPAQVLESLDAMIEACLRLVVPGAQIVIMSNGGFGGIHRRLVERLRQPQ